MVSKRSAERVVINHISSGLIRYLVNKNVDPMLITYASFALSIAAALSYSLTALGPIYAVAGGMAFLASGLLDALDGEVARLLGRTSKKGAFLDSVLDKISEVAVALGIASSAVVSTIAVTSFIASSFLVSYCRSRAEQLGVELAGVGIAERGERMVMLGVASFMYPLLPAALEYSLIIISILAGITIVQRIMYVRGRL